MKTIRIVRSLFGLLMVLLPMVGHTQDWSATSCKNLLRETYAKMNAPAKSLRSGARYEMECQMRVAPRDSQEVGVYKTTIRFSMDKNSFAYESGVMSYYLDKKMSATVIPRRQVIYLSEAKRQAEQLHPLEVFTSAMDSLLQHCEVVWQRTQLDETGREVQVIDAVLNAHWRRVFEAEQIRYWIAAENRQLQKVRILHPPAHQAAYSEIEYTQLDFDAEGPALAKPVRDLIFAQREELNTTYQNYQIIQIKQ